MASTVSALLDAGTSEATISPRKRALSDASRRQHHMQAPSHQSGRPGVFLTVDNELSRGTLSHSKLAQYRERGSAKFVSVFDDSGDFAHSRPHLNIGPGSAFRFRDDSGSLYSNPRRPSISTTLTPLPEPPLALATAHTTSQRRFSIDPAQLFPIDKGEDDHHFLPAAPWLGHDVCEAQYYATTADQQPGDASFESTSFDTSLDTSTSSALTRDSSHDISAITEATSDNSQDFIEAEMPTAHSMRRHARTDSGTFSRFGKGNGGTWPSSPFDHFFAPDQQLASSMDDQVSGPFNLGEALAAASAFVPRSEPARSRSQLPDLRSSDRAGPLRQPEEPLDPLIGISAEHITLDEADPKAIAAALHYHRTSPSRAARGDTGKIACELCGALVLRWAVLLPCQHRACSACCCSGVNQVSTTPPRRHVCAACQVPVNGLTLSFTAAEAARAAAWRGTPTLDDAPAVSNDGTQTCNSLSGGADLSGRFPGVTEALLGLHRPVRGRSASVVATAVSLRPNQDDASSPSSPMLGSTSLSEGNCIDDPSGNADSSMFFSDDASFYFHPDATRARKHSSAVSSPRKVGKPPGAALKVTVSEQRENTGGKISTATGGPATPTVYRPTIALAYSPCAVVRVDNIPWTTSYQDIVKWCPEPYSLLPDGSVVAQPVHVPVDLKTGKTANCAFIELRDSNCAKKLIRHRNNTKLRGRPVSLQLSNYEELRAELFPSIQHFSPGISALEMVFLTPWHFDQMSRLVKMGGPQLKSPLKPIELVITWIQLLPPTLPAEQRDGLFQRALEVFHRGVEWLGRSIDGLYFALQRLVQACANWPAFTAAQKMQVLEQTQRIPALKLDADVVKKLSEPIEVVEPAAAGAGTECVEVDEGGSALGPSNMMVSTVNHQGPPERAFVGTAPDGLIPPTGAKWMMLGGQVPPRLPLPGTGAPAGSSMFSAFEYRPSTAPSPIDSPFANPFPLIHSPLHPWYTSGYDRAFPGPYTGSLPDDWLSQPAGELGMQDRQQ